MKIPTPMFFIGGFNSVIPYLLYLSLIWAFLIIGFSGKISSAWLGKIRKTEVQVSLQSEKTHYTVHYIRHFEQEKSVFIYNRGDIDIPCEIPSITISCCDDYIDNPFHVNSLTFRGPPVHALI